MNETRISRTVAYAKHKYLFLLLGLFLMVSFSAMADQQIYALPILEESHGEENWMIETYNLLVSGDTVHFLKYHYSSSVDMLDDEDMWMMSVGGGDCYTLNQQGEIVACSDHCGDVIALIETSCYSPFFGLVTTSQNETYLIDMIGKVFHWTPGKDSAWEIVLQLDMSGLQSIQSEWDDFYYAADEDGLYLIYPSVQEGFNLYAFDWQSGKRKLITSFGQVSAMAPAGPGKLLISGTPKTYGYGHHYLVDCRTGEVTELVSGLQGLKVSSFIWDRVDGWYYVTYDTVQRLGMDTEEASIASFTGKTGLRDVALSTDGQHLLILAGEYSGYNFIILDLKDSSATLIINGNTNLLNQQFGAISSMVGDSTELASVQFELRSNVLSANDVAQLLLTRDDSSDVLIISPASVDLRNLLAKRYFVSLNDQPEIQAYFDELYPAWRDACMWQDSIAALPLYVYDNYQFMYNTELWEEYGLDVPTNYHELFATIREMDDVGLLEDYPLFEINGWDTRSFNHLLYKLLGDYILHCEEYGSGLRFDDPVLEQLLQELSELRDLLDRHDSRHLTGSPLMAFCGYVTIALGDPLYTQYGQYAPVLLSLDNTRGPVLQSYLTVLVVNPYSKNIELAKAWLSYLAANPTALTRCVFLTGMPNGVETEQSRIEYAKYRDKEAALQQQYDKAQASGDPDAIEEAREALYGNIEPMHVWVVNPEKAYTLYQALPYAHVIHYNPFGILLDNGDQAIQEYLTGKRSAHDLLQALQSLAMMIDAEGL